VVSVLLLLLLLLLTVKYFSFFVVVVYRGGVVVVSEIQNYFVLKYLKILILRSITLFLWQRISWIKTTKSNRLSMTAPRQQQQKLKSRSINNQHHKLSSIIPTLMPLDLEKRRGFVVSRKKERENAKMCLIII
jgi:hypothetical protein